MRMEPTDLRLNEDYIFYYQNNARLLITGLIPLFMLVTFNTLIYRALKARTPLGKSVAFNVVKT